MNFEGLRDDVLSMIAGESVTVNTGSFTNDKATFHTEDDVLTLLIHLGYLAYDYDYKTVKIPNKKEYKLRMIEFLKSFLFGIVEGYQILKAYDGIEALEILEKEKVNLLIIDVMMPRLDGIRATLKNSTACLKL